MGVIVPWLIGMHFPSAHGVFFMLKIFGVFTEVLCLESEIRVLSDPGTQQPCGFGKIS